MEGVDKLKLVHSYGKGNCVVSDWMFDWVMRGKTVDEIIEHDKRRPKPTRETC